MICPKPLPECPKCNKKPCGCPEKIDCVMSPWEPFGKCSSKCGPGTMNYVRHVITEAKNGGWCPSSRQEVRACNNGVCVAPAPVPAPAPAPAPPIVDCVLSDFELQGDCSALCGQGQAKWVRKVITYPANGGKQCASPLEELRSCIGKEGACATPLPNIDCEVSTWEAGKCVSKNGKCGPGTQINTRRVLTNASGLGKQCPSNLTETVDCSGEPCPVDCVIGNWSDWSSCTYDGIQTRVGTIITPAEYGGKVCGDNTETQKCDPPMDCVLGSWSTEWEPLNKDVQCGTTVTQKKTRTIIPEKNGGKCPDSSTEITQEYIAPPCPVDCVAGDWSDWLPLDKDVACGTTVTQTKNRTITPAMYGGNCNKLPTETRQYTAPPCPYIIKNISFGGYMTTPRRTLAASWREAVQLCQSDTQCTSIEENSYSIGNKWVVNFGGSQNPQNGAECRDIGMLHPSKSIVYMLIDNLTSISSTNRNGCARGPSIATNINIPLDPNIHPSKDPIYGSLFTPNNYNPIP